MESYRQNIDITYKDEPLFLGNEFVGKEKKIIELPKFEDIKEKLPSPVWERHETAVNAYYKAWEIAFSNIANPPENSLMTTPFIDTAFNGNLFMWDSAFILMFAKYGSHVFNFQETIDNFYALQHRDGFICREIIETTGTDRFTRFDPSATGPNIFPWCEWEYYKMYNDKDRVRKIFPVLAAYHRWLKEFATWRDGSYRASGFACGMDNLPRVMPEYNMMFSHGHMVWIDTCFQQILSCDMLINMGEVIGRDTEEFKAEKEHLAKYINKNLWDEVDGFYYDLWKNGKLNKVKTVASFWGLLTDAVPKERMEKLISHLENENEFKRPHRVPTLSYDHPDYKAENGYWQGSVWAPTNYMILRGLTKQGYHTLAREIAVNHYENMLCSFEKTGTFWENYAPEFIGRGTNTKDFIGWTGLIPIAELIEYIFGIQCLDKAHIVWRINCTEKHGIKNYPIGGGFVTLICEERTDAYEKPKITVETDLPINVEYIWDGGHENQNSKNTASW